MNPAYTFNQQSFELTLNAKVSHITAWHDLLGSVTLRFTQVSAVVTSTELPRSYKESSRH